MSSPEGLGVNVGQLLIVAELQFDQFWKILEGFLFYYHQIVHVV